MNFITIVDNACQYPISFCILDKDLFKLSTDASDFATGAVLSQKDMQTNLWYPVAFFSKSLDVHERNYKIYDKELLAVIWGLEKYKYYLEGHPYKVEI